MQITNVSMTHRNQIAEKTEKMEKYRRQVSRLLQTTLVLSFYPGGASCLDPSQHVFSVKSKHRYHVYVIGTCFCSLSYFCNLVEIAICKWVSQLPLGFLLHQLAHWEDRKAWCHVRGRKPQNGSLLYSAVFCCILAQLKQGGAAQVSSYLLPHMVEAQHGLLFYYSMAFILFLRDVFSLSWIQCLCSECKLTRLKWGISESY